MPHDTNCAATCHILSDELSHLLSESYYTDLTQPVGAVGEDPPAARRNQKA